MRGADLRDRLVAGVATGHRWVSRFARGAAGRVHGRHVRGLASAGPLGVARTPSAARVCGDRGGDWVLGCAPHRRDAARRAALHSDRWRRALEHGAAGARQRPAVAAANDTHGRNAASRIAIGGSRGADRVGAAIPGRTTSRHPDRRRPPRTPVRRQHPGCRDRLSVRRLLPAAIVHSRVGVACRRPPQRHGCNHCVVTREADPVHPTKRCGGGPEQPGRPCRGDEPARNFPESGQPTDPFTSARRRLRCDCAFRLHRARR